MKSILIVDDDPQVRNFLVRVFKAEGFTAGTAADGLEGLEKAATDKPDLMIVDVAMPKLDGVGLCAMLKKNPATSAIPVLFLSGDGHMGLVEDALKEGGEGYVLKPFDLPRFMEKVRGILDKR